jgi:hypothetical protein
VLFLKLSKLLNQGDALSALCFSRAEGIPRATSGMKTGYGGMQLPRPERWQSSYSCFRIW